MGEGVDPSPPLSRIRRRRLLLLLMQWRPRLLAEWRARQLGPCWFSISHWTTASLGALCPLPLRPSDAAEWRHGAVEHFEPSIVCRARHDH